MGLFSILMFMTAGCPDEEKRIRIGWIENARVYPSEFVFKAKIDTGADHSSLHASNVKVFKRDGDKWARFVITNKEGEKATIERPVLRTAKIKRHGAPDQERPVVGLGICVAGVYKEVQVNLTDRRGFKYKMLIGRSYMTDSFYVDPVYKHLTEPTCKGVPPL